MESTIHRVWIAFLLLYSFLEVDAAIRCYCNRPECEAGGYTCISQAEKCFSKLYTVYSKHNETTTSQSDEHGCVDMVQLSGSQQQPSMCDGTGDVVKQLKAFEPLIMCCSDSMCNYRQSQDIHVDIVGSQAISSAGTNVEEESPVVREDNSESSDDTSGDTVFRAAVIAVPIAGGLILVVLILMAVRMLREDYHRRSDRRNSFRKAQSFIQQHFSQSEVKCLPHPKVKAVKNNSSKRSEKSIVAPIHKNKSLVTLWVENEDSLLTKTETVRSDHSLSVSLLPKRSQSGSGQR